MIYRREVGRLTPADFCFVEAEATSISRFATQHPDLGVKKIDTYRSPVIGPRLIGSRADGADHAVLSIVSLDSGYLSRKTQLAVDRILEHVNKKAHEPPPGLVRAITGSAAVGRDTHAATDESIEATTNATVALVILILLDHLPIGAAGARAPGHDRLLGVCLAPADRAVGGTSGPRTRGDRRHADLRRRRALRRRDRLLSLPGHQVSGGARAREIAGRGDPRSDLPGGAGGGRERLHGNRRARDARLLAFRNVPDHRARRSRLASPWHWSRP